MEGVKEEQNVDQSSENERINDVAKEVIEDEKVLQFLDSLDSYTTLMDSLSSTLREGWLDLASARYSMGTSRVTSALFDLKLHPADTTLRVTELDGEYSQQDSMAKQPQFALSRGSSINNENSCSKEIECDEELRKKSNSSVLRHRGTSEISADKEHTSKADPVSPQSPLIVDDQVQKVRSKSLSVFGTLVSPKLRESQVSFETALATLVEMANMRSMLLSAHAQIQRKKEGTVG